MHGRRTPRTYMFFSREACSFCSAALLIGLLASSVRGSEPAVGREAAAARLLVPAYFYPAGEGRKQWDRLIAAAKEVPIVAIANPASGPGDTRDANYAEVLPRAAAAGVTLIGYVTTSYNKRPKEDVQAEIDRWFELYPEVSGIFFDEQPSGGEHAAAMIDYSQYVREKLKLHESPSRALGSLDDDSERDDPERSPSVPRPLVVSNPGTWCDAKFFAKGGPDIICIYENKLPISTIDRPRGAEKLPPARLAALAHSLDGESYAADSVQAVLRKKIGCLYVTDAPNGTKNPWDRLPSEWEEMVEAVKEANRAAANPRR